MSVGIIEKARVLDGSYTTFIQFTPKDLMKIQQLFA